MPLRSRGQNLSKGGDGPLGAFPDDTTSRAPESSGLGYEAVKIPSPPRTAGILPALGAPSGTAGILPAPCGPMWCWHLACTECAPGPQASCLHTVVQCGV